MSTRSVYTQTMNIEIRNKEGKPTEYVKILYEQHNKENSQRLRREQTKEEGKLWYIYLRKYKVTFTRQKPLGEYIVDFYCHKAKLVIEIDGAQHYESDVMLRDEERKKYLERMGLKVIRFTNWDINHNLEGVCLTIDREVTSRI
ncbi:MAG: endonuclease domain-containing protein [Phascolarctobacterium sp.]|nr:endonuclease domain-containing protein [Phascolarctobacterium sp.]